MKALLNPGTVLGAIVAITGALVGRWEAVLIGLGMAAVGLFVFATKRSAQLRSENPLDQVSNQNRSRILPIRRLAVEIEEIVDASPNDPIVQVIGNEAKADAQRVLASAVRVLQIRDSLRKSLSEQGVLDRQMAELRRQAEAAANAEEREMLRSALALREEQHAQLALAEEAIGTIDANLAQASAVLSELKTRLALSASGGADLDQDDMRETISRLHSLGASLDEAEQFLGGQP